MFIFGNYRSRIFFSFTFKKMFTFTFLRFAASRRRIPWADFDLLHSSLEASVQLWPSSIFGNIVTSLSLRSIKHRDQAVKRSKQHHILHVSGSNLSKRLKVPFSRSWVPMSKAARTINNGASQYFLRLAVTHSSSPPIIDITDWTPHTEIHQRLIYWVEARWQKCAIASISCKCFTLTPLFRPTSLLIFAKSLKA